MSQVLNYKSLDRDDVIMELINTSDLDSEGLIFLKSFIDCGVINNSITLNQVVRDIKRNVNKTLITKYLSTEKDTTRGNVFIINENRNRILGSYYFCRESDYYVDFNYLTGYVPFTDIEVLKKRSIFNRILFKLGNDEPCQIHVIISTEVVAILGLIVTAILRIEWLFIVCMFIIFLPLCLIIFIQALNIE